MIEYLQTLSYWDWFAIALAMVVIEIFVSGTYFLWLGFAAGVVGFFMIFFPETNWKIQLVIFSVTAIASILVWQWAAKSAPQKSGIILNQRGANYIGQVYTLQEDLVDGQGHLTIDDTVWQVKGRDLVKGDQVRVVALESIRLVLEKVDAD